MKTKYCPGCEKTKLHSEFAANRGGYTKDNLQVYCKECNKAYREEAKNKKRQKQYQKEYCSNKVVKEKKRKTTEEYAKKHRAKIRAFALVKYYLKKGHKLEMPKN